MTDKIEFATAFAKWKHKDQKRKYTGELYFNHCMEVAETIKQLALDDSEDMICAALLHDTIEDTDTNYTEIEKYFGLSVAKLVYWLSDISNPEDGNRAERKRLDREHIWRAPREAQIIKLADLISNTKSIKTYDPNFAGIYLEEKRLLLTGLDKSLPLYGRALGLTIEDNLIDRIDKAINDVHTRILIEYADDDAEALDELLKDCKQALTKVG